jgi:hypothetical protein
MDVGKEEGQESDWRVFVVNDRLLFGVGTWEEEGEERRDEVKDGIRYELLLWLKRWWRRGKKAGREGKGGTSAKRGALLE